MSVKSQQQRKLKVVEKPDKEARLAAAKLKRETRCATAINALLVEHDCVLILVAHINGAVIPLDQLIACPLAFNVTAK